MNLQPCKVCGGKAVKSPFTDMCVTTISCGSCRHSVSEIGDKTAVAKWNGDRK
jgi:hypothetical protein